MLFLNFLYFFELVYVVFVGVIVCVLFCFMFVFFMRGGFGLVFLVKFGFVIYIFWLLFFFKNLV